MEFKMYQNQSFNNSFFLIDSNLNLLYNIDLIIDYLNKLSGKSFVCEMCKILKEENVI